MLILSTPSLVYTLDVSKHQHIFISILSTDGGMWPQFEEATGEKAEQRNHPGPGLL